jgi:hypothetical protein
MAAPAGAFVLKNPVITIGGTSYANQLTKARLLADTPTVTIRTLVPDGSVTDVDTAVWTLELAGIQDWKNAQGLADFLNDNTNVLVTVVLQPKPGSGEKSATFQMYAHPVDFGGEQGQFATFDATFGIQGSPVFSDAA